MSNVPDNDVQRLYSEISRLSALVQAQNARINQLESNLERFMTNTNFAISKIQVIGDMVSNIGELLPVLSDFFNKSKEDVRI